MKKSGQIVLFQFPQTDLASGKQRPALLLGKLPGSYDDWLNRSCIYTPTLILGQVTIRQPMKMGR